jgi:hypothetical protein
MLNTISTILFTLSVLLLHTPNVRQQDYNDIDGLIKLAKYASWPDENVPDATVMVAAGENVYEYASSTIENTYIRNMKLKVEPFDINSDMKNVKIIFISSDSNIDIKTLKEKMQNMKILTITNDINKIEGCMFYIDYNGETLDYLYNKETILESGLDVSSYLLSSLHSWKKNTH